MEDGSIFVCFLCEKEFRQVSLLQEHMTEHGTLPEMSDDLPSRKKAKTQQIEGETSKISMPHKPKHEHKSLVNVPNKEKIPKPSVNGHTESRNLKPNVCKTSSQPVSSPSLSQVDHKPQKEKADQENTIPTAKVKPDPDAEFSLAMKRAMRIKKYIERKENTAKRKIDSDKDEEEDELNEYGDSGFDGAQESIMMVDSSFFNSNVATRAPVGPTIMNSEPDGFMVPHKVSSVTHSVRGRKKKSYGLKSDNYIKQDIFYDDMMDDTEEPEMPQDNQLKEFRLNEIPQTSMRGKFRGRGRGKRGRPLKIKEEAESDPTLDYFVELRPGRRSKPRGSDESNQVSSYQCLECYKEYRSVSTMKVHMKSHTEDREIHCPYCDEVFPQRHILYSHLVNDHEESSNLTCPVCNKIFTRPDSLKSHMVRMHEENGGLNCYVCGKNFPSQGQLEMHVRVHTGERPFKCDLCSKGFVQKVHLRTHLRTMHNMTEANTTPCRICEEKFDGRVGLRDHYTTVHSLTTTQYKNMVAKLRKEGKIPEILPPKVRVVDPSFRYQKISVTEMEPTLEESLPTHTPERNGERCKPMYLTRRAGRKLKIRTRQERIPNRPGMGTVMNLVSEEVMFSPMNFDLEGDQPKGRDQEELSIVENAFKVAEEMDNLGEGNTTILMTDDSSSSGIYYSLPIEMDEEADEEYAQFAAEHAHIEGVGDAYDPDLPGGEEASSSKASRRGAIVKAEPLEIYSDAMDSTQAVEMLTM